MELPKEIQIGGQIITTQICEELGGKLGKCCCFNGYIKIAANVDGCVQTESSMFNSYVHECIHIILDTMGRGDLSSDETFVSSFAGFATEGLVSIIKTKLFVIMEDKCKDCTNDKGCINCEDGNLHEVKKKKPEGALKELLDNIDTTEYEKISREMKEYAPNEEFENFAKAYMEENDANIVSFYDRYAGLVDGVRWQKVNLWKPADGDDLPEINREVIVLVKALPEHEDGMLKVAFGHRPPEYWDGKNIDTGEVTRYYPKRYDKGGWNQPDVVFWLDLDLPIKEL